MVQYTVAMCNKNMAETIEQSVRSIARQLNDDYEILIVDDSSTDGSREILSDLAEEYTNLHVVDGTNRNLAEARNQSFKEANGDYILESLDADDVYSPGITDFVEIYEQIDECLEFAFYLKGNSINMAPRELLLDYPYRSMKRAEDYDLWKRLFADDKIIWLDHEPFWEEIDDGELSFCDKLELNQRKKISLLRSGTTLSSTLSYHLRNKCLFDPVLYYHLIADFFAYILAKRRGIYKSPSPFYDRSSLEEQISEAKMTIDEIELEYDINIDRDQLSDAGRRIFCKETPEY